MSRPDESNRTAPCRRVVQLSSAMLPVLLLLATTPRSRGTDDPVLVRVNSTPITRSSVREIVKSVIVSSPQIPNAAEIDQLMQEALDSLIDLELLYQEAEARKLALPDAAVESELAETRRQFGKPEDFAAALRRSGMTEDELRAETRKTLLANQLLETVVWRDINISREDIETFFRENRSELGNADQVHIRQIFLRISPGSPATVREQALLRAQQLRARIESGADFEQLARENSDDPVSAPRGGDLGFVERTDQTSPLIAAAVGLEIGAVSEVVESAEGYHLVQLVARRPGSSQMPAEMEQRIVKMLEERERRRRQSAFVDELRKKATIEFVSTSDATSTPKH